jgi:hypothetical protein
MADVTTVLGLNLPTSADIVDYDKFFRQNFQKIDDKFKDSADARAFGAKGDGVTDDTAALQAYLNTTIKDILIKDGTFRITSGLTSSLVGRSIHTEGATILVDGGTDVTALLVSGDKTKVSVNIDGGNKAAIGVDITGAGCEVTNCKIENLTGVGVGAFGIRVTSSGGSRVTNNAILNVTATSNGTIGDNPGSSRGILVTSTSAAQAMNIVKNNFIAGVTGEEGDAIQFLFFDGASYPFLSAQGVISNNIIKNCNRRAIKVQASDVEVSLNKHFNTLLASDMPNKATLINVIQSNNVSVKYNEVDASTGFMGIAVNGGTGVVCDRCTVKGNIVRGSTTTHGIYFDYASNLQVEQNTVYDGNAGIAGSNSTDVSISENTLYGGNSTAVGYSISSVSNNSRVIIKGNKAPSGQRLYMINNQSPNAFVQGNFGNVSTILIQTSSAATGSIYTQNVNKAGTLMTGTTTGQTITEDGAWTNVSFQNSYRSYGGNYAPVQYRKLVNGTVELRGAAASVGVLEPAIMFTLPTGFRPAYDSAFASVDNKNNHCTVIARADGTVTIQASTSGGFSGGITQDVDTAFISLENVRFSTSV